MARISDETRSENCERAADVYIPFGLLANIPDEWECNWNGNNDFAQLSSQKLTLCNIGCDPKRPVFSLRCKRTDNIFFFFVFFEVT